MINPFESMHVCVSKCPNKRLDTPQEVKEFCEETDSRLCAYNVDIEDYGDGSLYTEDGPCPDLPVYKR